MYEGGVVFVLEVCFDYVLQQVCCFDVFYVLWQQVFVDGEVWELLVFQYQYLVVLLVQYCCGYGIGWVGVDDQDFSMFDSIYSSVYWCVFVV